MLPLRLNVENFMPYRGRQPTLELEGLRVACLAGNNGHGKTALLEAVTWALWGEARAPDDDLVTQGAAEMAVELDFQVAEARYRIVRRHARPRGKKRSGQTSLHFLLLGEDGSHPLDGVTIRETEERIRETIGLDYETFVNSAFLLQGQADRFTTKRPAERKEVLGDILRLGRYDVLAERAREEARARENATDAIHKYVESLEREMEGEAALQGQVEPKGKALQALRQSVGQRESSLREREEQAARLRVQSEMLARMKTDVQRLEGERADQQRRQAEARERLAQTKALVARRQEIEAGYAAFQAARTRAAALGEKASRYAELLQRRGEIEGLWQEARSSLLREEARLAKELEDSQREAARAGALAALLEEFSAQRAALEKEEEVLESGKAEVQRMATNVRLLEETLKRLGKEMQELRERQEFLGVGGGGARCPLCGTELGEHGLEEVKAHYAERQGDVQRELEEGSRALNQERHSLNQTVASARQEESRLRKSRETLREQAGALGQEKERAEKATEQARDLAPALVSLRQRLENGTFAPEEGRALREIETDIAALEYDLQAHRSASAEAEALERWDADWQAIQSAIGGLSRDEASLAETETRVVDLEGRLVEERREKRSLEEAVAGLPALEGQVSALRTEVEALRRREEQEGKELARLQAELEHLVRRRAERDAQVREAVRRAEEKAVFDELATAFGKKGVQALLIETALPELEEEANALLARMTDNRMHVRLETQRLTRGGETQETLEVAVGDEWGTRPYELFSGGEAFRINFALRVALSKLLARRAGAPLSVLFMDEGFGTQDALGRERLVEAIGVVREDFPLILVITHMQEIKELFDVRIEVEKTEAGSTFRLVR
ncbi:MAG: SMC family ATPase [Chloroflexi bacterium]|nr:SMC family ATPase [Chloroflexota bacterium]